jgi:hypothetical protein
MPKKKYIAARDLKDYLPNLSLKTEKAKKENLSSFIAAILCFQSRNTYRVASARLCLGMSLDRALIEP